RVTVGEGIGDQVAGGELLELRERVTGAADHQQFVACGWAALDRLLITSALDQADVEVTRGDAVFGELGGAEDDPRQPARIASLEALEDLRQPVGGDGGAGADLDLASEIVGKLRNARIELCRQAKDLLGVGQ